MVSMLRRACETFRPSVTAHVHVQSPMAAELRLLGITVEEITLSNFNTSVGIRNSPDKKAKVVGVKNELDSDGEDEEEEKPKAKKGAKASKVKPSLLCRLLRPEHTLCMC